MSMPLRPGDLVRLGRYELVGRLGEGGMGTVYLGRAPGGRPVAIKTVRPEFAAEAEFRGRFRSEVNRAQQVPPFSTAEVLDADPDHEPPYLVVEYVDGSSLAAEIRENGPLSGSALHSVAVGVATALTAIHGAGVIHRDLKPGNVLFARGGIKVIDFGIARAFEATSQHTRTDQMVGTVAYMAPERFDPIDGRPVTAAADIFAWGAVVVYAATGRTPFAAESAAATAMRILTQAPDLNGVPRSLIPVVERALAKDPAERPSARELLDLLLASSRSGEPPSSGGAAGSSGGAAGSSGGAVGSSGGSVASLGGAGSSGRAVGSSGGPVASLGGPVGSSGGAAASPGAPVVWPVASSASIATGSQQTRFVPSGAGLDAPFAASADAGAVVEQPRAGGVVAGGRVPGGSRRRMSVAIAAGVAALLAAGLGAAARYFATGPGGDEAHAPVDTAVTPSPVTPSVAGPVTAEEKLAAILRGNRQTLIHVAEIDRDLAMQLHSAEVEAGDGTGAKSLFALDSLGVDYMIRSMEDPSVERCVGVKVIPDVGSRLVAADCTPTKATVFSLVRTEQTDDQGRPTYWISNEAYGHVQWSNDRNSLIVEEIGDAPPLSTFSFVDRGPLPTPSPSR